MLGLKIVKEQELTDLNTNLKKAQNKTTSTNKQVKELMKTQVASQSQIKALEDLSLFAASTRPYTDYDLINNNLSKF